MHKSENHYQAPIVQNNKKNRHESGTNLHKTERKRHKTELTCTKRKICIFCALPKNTIENQWFIRASNINETQIVGAIINRPSACTQRIIN